MKRTIAAIPTLYNGTQFRSRLEARWAAMFDLLEWKWEYEPFDLNGYIPDFILAFPKPMIVEVKPLVGNVNRWDEGDDGILAIEKAIDSGWDGEGLLVGATLYTDKLADGCVDEGHPTNAGLLFELANFGSGPIRYSAPFGFSACCGGPVDCIGSYRCRRCGHYNGCNDLVSSTRVTSLWRRAGNLVQWKAPVKQEMPQSLRGSHERVPVDEVFAMFRAATDLEEEID